MQPITVTWQTPDGERSRQFLAHEALLQAEFDVDEAFFDALLVWDRALWEGDQEMMERVSPALRAKEEEWPPLYEALLAAGIKSLSYAPEVLEARTRRLREHWELRKRSRAGEKRAI